MTIYLHPIDETPNHIDHDKWVEIDLVSWTSNNSDHPLGFTLVRRLNPEGKKPYLQELMFEGLYKGLAIKQLILEIPGADENDITIHHLRDVYITNYTIHPNHGQKKPSYEKITLIAKSQKA